MHRFQRWLPALGPRQFTALFLGTVTCGLLLSTGYLVARTSRRQPAPAPMAPIRVEPATTPAAQPGPEPAPQVTAPAPGMLFLQVGAGDRDGAAKLARSLAGRGMPVLTAEGPREDLVRILVGPIPNSEEMSRLKGQLETAGYQPFPRRY